MVSEIDRPEVILTPRQLEVFQLLAKGLSNREICELLGISANTVKIHVTSILRTLNVTNRTEAVYAYKDMLRDPNDSPARATSLELVDRIGRPSIAVLPMEFIGVSQQDVRHIVRGVEEELLARLSTWQWFPVVALASSRLAAQQAQDPIVLGNALRARYLISGSIRQDGNRMRANVHLVEAAAGTTLWTRGFDFPRGDMFAMQTEVAKQVVAAIAPELIAAEASLSRYRAAADFTVWDNVCRGAWYMHRMTPPDSLLALEHFDAAIAQDADFGLAFSGKVSTHQVRLYQQWSEDRETTVHELIASAHEALRLEPRASYAHSSAGLGHILLGDRRQALAHLEQAVQLNPSSTTGLNLLGQAYGMSGRLDDCIMHMEDLLRIDPYSSSAYIYHNVLGMCHYLENRYAEGVQWSESSIALNPKATGAYVSLIAAHVEAGNGDEATAALHKLNEQAPTFRLQSLFDMMQAFTQREMLDRLRDTLARVGLTE